MSLHDSDSLVIEADGTAESLPDPTTVQGRTHALVNTRSPLTATWSAPVGFTENGVNVPSITIPPGQVKMVQSNGSRWIVQTSPTGRHIVAMAAVTNGSGIASFTFPTPFAALPVVQGQVGPSNDNALVECRLETLTTSGCTFRVRRAPAVTVLGISVVTFPVNASGATVQMTATDAGETF